MSSLKKNEKTLLEALFDMSGGYVLDFTDATFEIFFEEFDVQIHSEKYVKDDGTSKAKKLREFWRIEPDYIVGKSIKEMIEHYETMQFTNNHNDRENSQLVEKCKTIANRLLSNPRSINELKNVFKEFDGHCLSEQIGRMEKSIQTDPSLAIGTAKELLETCCKTILLARGVELEGNSDIPTLTKKTFKELKLLPDQIQNHKKGARTIKKLLSNLGTVGQCVAELRNLYGTGHGKHGYAKGLSPRHAKLAVGAISTLATFLYETHIESYNDQSPK